MEENSISDQLSQIWNFGHIIQCLKYMIKTNWKEGIRCLFGLRRVKQIFLSINETKSFLDALNILIDLFFFNQSQSAEDMKHIQYIFLDQFEQKPYILAKILLGLYVKFPAAQITELIKKFDRESMPFFKNELEDIFEKFDPEYQHQNVLQELLRKQEDEEMEEDDVKRAIMQVSLNVKDLIFKSKILQPGDSLDEDACEKLIDDMDALHPFSYKIGVSETEQTS